MAASGAEHLVIRTSGLLGRGGSEQKGGSFADRILARAREGQPLRVVADQTFAPTLAPDLAAAALALVGAGARGLFHVANAGSCSWHDLAVATLALAGVDAPVEAIATSDLDLAARRPGVLGAGHRAVPRAGPPAPASLARGPGRVLSLPRPIDARGGFRYSFSVVRWAVSSAVEHWSYTPGVTGSNPVPPTRLPC